MFAVRVGLGYFPLVTRNNRKSNNSKEFDIVSKHYSVALSHTLDRFGAQEHIFDNGFVGVSVICRDSLMILLVL